jgi:hypothetical protein
LTQSRLADYTGAMNEITTIKTPEWFLRYEDGEWLYGLGAEVYGSDADVADAAQNLRDSAEHEGHCPECAEFDGIARSLSEYDGTTYCRECRWVQS